MDALTHVFLPLTLAYVLWPTSFKSPRFLALGLLGLFPDLDKFLGMPGLLHSFITILPLCLLLFALEYYYRGRYTYSGLLTFFLASHLLLDLLDGSGVYPLYPLVKTGIGLEYPIQIVFGEGTFGVTFEGYPVSAFLTEPRPGFAVDESVDADAYGFIGGFGITSTLTFLIIYVGLKRRWDMNSD